ncbi:hypothetical protein TNCV_807571 [Trichonephila clavipes]|nr:hypothetical protein TNCV_807571 [Trichonephila clavipes]
MRSRVESLNPVFALQQHTTPTAGVMVWGVISNITWSPIVLIRGTMTATHVWDHLGRRVEHSTSLNEGYSKYGTKFLKTSYRTRMPRCPIVSYRTFVLEGVEQGIKSSVLLPFSLK